MLKDKEVVKLYRKKITYMPTLKYRNLARIIDYYVKNKNCNTGHWAAMINAHVEWMQNNTTHPVIGVSPYNEPDYWTEAEGATVEKQVEVKKK